MRFNLWEDCNRVPLTELLSFIVDNRGKTVPTAPSGHKLIATNCVTNNTLFPVYEKIRYLSEETYQTWFRAHPIPGDILFVNKGTPGRVCLVPDPVDFCIAQDMIALRADESKIYPKYLFAVLRSREIQQQIYNTNVGDVIPHFKKQFLNQLLIPIPERSIQESIGDLYYVLSLKAERNKKINDNLQQQAFSVFDNLIANAENNDYTVSAYAFLNPKRTLAKNQVARSIDMSQLSTSGAFPSGWEMKPFNGGMRFTNGDTLLARITPCLENGKTAFIDFLDDGEVAFGSTEYIVLAPKNDTPPEMLYCLARYPAFVDYAVKNMNGSSGRQRVSAETVGQYRLPLFDKHSLVLFKEVVSPMFLKMRYNSLENMRLAELRDALLPKLMSGEIDVSAVQL